MLRLSWRIVAESLSQFLADDGWAIASHIALSALMALFPFLIVVTALAGFFFGSKDLADEAAQHPAGDVAAAGRGADRRSTSTACSPACAAARSPSALIFAIYFASSGVESLRIGLNRAYSAAEQPRLVGAAAGIDRLCADRRGRPAGASLSWSCWRR